MAAESVILKVINVNELSGAFLVRFLVQVITENPALWNDRSVVFFDHEGSLLRVPDGRVHRERVLEGDYSLTAVFPTELAGKTVEINGCVRDIADTHGTGRVWARPSVQVKFPSLSKKEVLFNSFELRSTPQEDGSFLVSGAVGAVDKSGAPIIGEELRVFDGDGVVVAAETTHSAGHASFSFILPKEKEGREEKFTARLGEQSLTRQVKLQPRTYSDISEIFEWMATKMKVPKLLAVATFIAIDLLLIAFMWVAGDLAVSAIMAGFIGWMVGATERGKWYHALGVAGAVVLVSLPLPQLTAGAFKTLLWVLAAGTLVYVYEEWTDSVARDDDLVKEGSNLFPWAVILGCVLIAVGAAVGAAFSSIGSHEHFLLEVDRWYEVGLVADAAALLPFSNHALAEIYRVWGVVSGLADSLKWLIAGFLFFLFAAPHEFGKWLQERKKSGSGEKRSGMTAGRFLAMDLAVEAVLAGYTKLKRRE